MAARWQDHILGPGTTAARPAASTVPEHALYENTTTGNLEIAVAGAWQTYRSAVSAGVASLTPGTNVAVDATDPAHPVVSATTDPEVVRDAIALALVAGANVTITPNDGADTITIAASGGGTTDPEVVRDTIAAALVPGSGVTITPNDGADTITIAATGGGGASVPTGADDLTTGWSWVNQSTSTLTVNGNSASLSVPARAQFNFSLRAKTTALTSALTLSARLRYAGGPSSYSWAGIMLRDSATGKTVTWGPEVGSANGFRPWPAHITGATYNGDIGAGPATASYFEFWRIRVASGSYFFEFSVDGINWVTWTTETQATFLTSYDQIAFGAHAGNGRDGSFQLDWIKAA